MRNRVFLCHQKCLLFRLPHLLCVAMLLGGIAGCILSCYFLRHEDGTLVEFLSDYVSLSAHPVPEISYLDQLWFRLRGTIPILLCGLTAFAALGMNVLFFLHGCVISFAACSFFHVFGWIGLFLSFVLFGLPLLFWMPGLFLLGSQVVEWPEKKRKKDAWSGHSLTVQFFCFCFLVLSMLTERFLLHTAVPNIAQFILRSPV